MLCGLTWEHLPVIRSAKWLGNLIHRFFNSNYSTISQRVFFIWDFQFHCLNLNSFPLCTGYFEFTTFPNFCGGDATWIHVTRFAGGFRPEIRPRATQDKQSAKLPDEAGSLNDPESIRLFGAKTVMNFSCRGQFLHVCQDSGLLSFSQLAIGV